MRRLGLSEWTSIAEIAGMLGVTFFGLFLTPVFYVVLRKLETRLSKTKVISEELSHDAIPNN